MIVVVVDRVVDRVVELVGAVVVVNSDVVSKQENQHTLSKTQILLQRNYFTLAYVIGTWTSIRTVLLAGTVFDTRFVVSVAFGQTGIITMGAVSNTDKVDLLNNVLTGDIVRVQISISTGAKVGHASFEVIINIFLV